MRFLPLILFIIHLLTRSIFVFVNGFFNNYALQPDSIWLVEFGLKNAANLNFNFELERFIASPLFPTIVGTLKILFNEHWKVVLILIQLILSSLSGVYVFKIGNLLFNRKAGLIASLIFAFFPLTLWYTNTFSQECIFQVLFIFSIFYLVKSIKFNSIYYVFISSIFFSLAYLTKSHILLFSIFIPIIYFHLFGLKKQSYIFVLIYAIVSLIFSIPYGVYSYKKHKQYVISSNGAGFQFYLGNTEVGYKTVVDVPRRGTQEFKNMQYVIVGCFNGSQSYYDSILTLSQKEKQKVFFNEGIKWIKSNPDKFYKLKLYNLLLFLIPGVSWRHYSLGYWISSFLLSLPIYFLAYYAMIKLYLNKDKNLAYILYVFISMLIFSLVWYVQNRFRTITIEPLYIIFASYIIANFIARKLPKIDRYLDGLNFDTNNCNK